VTQARAIARVTEADFYPNVTLDPAIGRTRFSGNRPVQPGTAVTSYNGGTATACRWMCLTKSTSGARFAIPNKLAVASGRSNRRRPTKRWRLTLFADVAQNYFALRSLDSEYDLVNRTIEYRKQGELELIRARYRGGASSELDVVRAEARGATNESELIANKREGAPNFAKRAGRAGGQEPDRIQAATESADIASPSHSGRPALPSCCIRRPDVAEAERRTAARNAEIGVATAAFFSRRLNLTGALGFERRRPFQLLDFGEPGVDPVRRPLAAYFEGGRNRCKSRPRQGCLRGETSPITVSRCSSRFEEVESALVGLRLLAQQFGSGKHAPYRTPSAPRRSPGRAKQRNGLVYFLDVLDAERTKLANQRLATEIEGPATGYECEPDQGPGRWLERQILTGCDGVRWTR
jgi:multidrug efflux system outer membrane protein